MFSFNLTRWFKSLFQLRRKPIVKKSRRTRLVLEALEDRLAPTTYTWTGAGGTPNWSNGANWVGNAAPTSASFLADLVFPGSASQRSTKDDVPGLVLNSITISASNYILGGAQPITLGNPTVNGSGTLIDNTGSLNDVISLPIQLSGASGSQQFFTVQQGAQLTLSGQISGVQASEVTKEGLGTLFITGNNTAFSGLFTIDQNAGIVSISNANALGSTLSSTQETLTLTGASAARTKMTFTFGGGTPAQSTTALINFTGTSADASAVQAAVNALPNISGAGGQVFVSQTNVGTTETFTFIFGGNFAGTNVTTPITGKANIQGSFGTPVMTPGQVATGNAVIVDLNSQLQLNGTNPAQPIIMVKPLVLNGPGIHNDGALLNVAGANNVWQGSVTLDSNTTIGAGPTSYNAATATMLTITGVISDNGSGFSLTKEGGGTLYLDPVVAIPSVTNPGQGNTYRGNTIVNGGVLQIGDPYALGAGGATTIVNSSILESGTLSLAFDPSTNQPVTPAQQHPQIASQYLINSVNQVVALGNAIPGVTQFTLTFGGATTLPITYTGTPLDASRIQTQLASLSSVTSLGGLPSVVQGSNSTTFIVSFAGAMIGLNPPLMTGTIYSAPPLSGPNATVAVSAAAGGPIGFRVPNELLTINGPGVEGVNVAITNGRETLSAATITSSGALNNQQGQNSWDSPVTLWSSPNSVISDSGFNKSTFPTANAPALGNVAAIGIGVAAGSSLAINGVMQDNGVGAGRSTAGQSPYSLAKTGPGRLILTNNNTFESLLDVLQGSLNVRDSNALGVDLPSPFQGKDVWFGASLELQADGIPDSATSTFVGTTLVSPNYNLLFPVATTILLNGTGLNNEGALRNISGVNKIAGNIVLSTASVNPITTLAPTSIGVDPDPDPENLQGNTWNNLSQLTVDGVISSALTSTTVLEKVGSGELVLTNTNTYKGPINGISNSQTLIDQGWITAQNDQALGQVLSSAVQTLTFSNANINTEYTLSFGDPTNPLNTSFPFFYAPNSPAFNISEITFALESLASIAGNAGVVFVTADPTDTVFTVTFGGGMASQTEPLIGAQIVFASPGPPAPQPSILARIVNAGGIRALDSGASVAAGAALVLKQDLGGNNLNFNYDMYLSGQGMSLGTPLSTLHPWLNQKGALENLDGANTATGHIFLNGITVQFQNGLGNQPIFTMGIPTGGNSLTGPGASVRVSTSVIGGPNTNAQQIITFNGSITGGFFTLQYFDQNHAAQTTPAIQWSANNLILASNVQNALSAIPQVGGFANVAAGGVGITFQNGLGNLANSALVANGAGLIPAGTSIVNAQTAIAGGPGVNNVQVVTFSGPITGGTFTLSYNGKTTTPIRWNATPSILIQNIQAALDALSSIGAGNTAVAPYGANNSVGIGVEVDGAKAPNGPVSQLFMTGETDENGSAAGITKLGSQRLVLEANGVNTGETIVAQGVLRIQNDTALGAGYGGTIVASGAALEIAPVLGDFDGGVARGLQVWGNHLTLFGTGDTAFQDATLSVLSSDNIWRGPVTLDSVISVTFLSGSNLGGVSVPTMSAFSALQGTNTSVNVATATGGGSGANTIQTISFGGNVTGGTFRLSINDSFGVPRATTAPITWTANTNLLIANIQAALNKLATQFGMLATGPGFVLVSLLSPLIDVVSNARLTVAGTIDDGTGSNAADMYVAGGGNLALAAANTFRGTTYVNQGVLTVDNGQGLGQTGIVGEQSLALNGATPGVAKFTLTFQTATSAPITYTGTDADLANIQNALTNLPTVGLVGGTVTVTAGNPGVFLINFGGTLANNTTALVTANVLTGPGTVVAGSEGGTIVAKNAQLELQRGVTVAGEPLVLQGDGSTSVVQQSLTFTGTVTNFTLSFNGFSTPSTTPLNYTGNALTDAATIQSALNGLTSIGGAGGSVTVTPGVPAGVFTVTFGGNLGGLNQTPISGVVTTGTGTIGTSTVQSVFGATSEVQNITIAGLGQFVLTFNGQTTQSMFTSTTTATQIENDLNALPSIGGVGGFVSVTQTQNANNDVFAVTFNGSLAGLYEPPITAAVNLPPTVSTAETVVGGPFGSPVETQTLNVAGSGTFTLSFTNKNFPNASPNTTNPVATIISAQGLQAVLNNLASIKAGVPNTFPPPATLAGTVTVTASVNGQNVPNSQAFSPGVAHVYTIQFTGGYLSASSTGEPLIFAAPTPPPSISVTTPTVGGTGNTDATPLQFFNTGPAPINNGQTLGNLPVSGRVTGLAVDPQNPNVMYVGTAGGGAWKSVDAGTSWEPIFDNVAAEFVGAIAIAPESPNIIYLGTGDATNATQNNNGFFFNAFATQNGLPYYGTGVYESQDYGVTWTLLTDVIPGDASNPMLGLGVSSIAVDPNHPDQIYVATSNYSVLNAPAPTLASPEIPGVFSFNVTGNNQWFNMTSHVSPLRATVAGTLGSIPNTAGPDDDFRLNFPQGKADWTEVKVVEADPNNNGNAQTMVYASLGNPDGAFANAVYRSPNPTTSTPVWYIGDPGALSSQVESITITGGGVFNAAFGPVTNHTINLTNFSGVGFITSQLQSLLLPGGTLTVVPGSVNVLANQITWNFTFGGILAFSPQPLFYIPPFGTSGGINVTFGIVTPGGGADNRSAEFPHDIVVNNVDHPLNGNIQFTVQYINKPQGPNQNQLVVYAAIANPYDPVLNFQYQAPASSILVSAPPPAAPFVTGGGIGWSPTGGQPNGNYMGTPLGSSFGEYAVGNYALTLVTDPADSNHSIVASVGDSLESLKLAASGPYETFDGGATWNKVGLAGVPGDVNGNSAPIDFHASTFISSGGDILFGTDGGVFRLHDAEATANSAADFWTNNNGTTPGATLSTIQVNQAAANPVDANITLAAAQNNGTSISSANTPGWTLTNISNPPGFTTATTNQNHALQIAYNPNNANIAYAVFLGVNTSSFGGFVSDEYTLVESLDGGVTWNTASPLRSSFNPMVLAVDPNNDQRLLLAYGTVNGFGFVGGVGLEETENQGTSWTNITPSGFFFGFAGNASTDAIGLARYQGTFQQDPSFANVTDQGVNAPDQGTIYFTDSVNIFVTKDGGVNWTPSKSAFNNTGNRNGTKPFGGGTVNAIPAGSTISDVVVDPTNRDTAYALIENFTGLGGGTGHVFRTTDAGQHWFDISLGLPDVPANSLAVDPRDGNLYLGTDTGMFVLKHVPATGAITLNSTNQWQSFSVGLPQARVSQVTLNQNTNLLTVATYGRGVYQFYLENQTAHSGGLRAESGSDVWTGPVYFSGAATVAANGTQALQTTTPAAQLSLLGTVNDLATGANNQLTKMGKGDVILAGVNTYGGTTVVQEGNLIVHNPQALGGTGVQEVQTLNVGTSGTFTLAFMGSAPTIAFGPGATAGQIQNALNGLSTIANAGGVVTVTPTGAAGTFAISFGGNFTGFAQPLLTVQDSGGSTAALLSLTQTLQIGNTGTFTLSFNGSAPTASLNPLTVTANQIATALNNLATVSGAGGSAVVLATGTPGTFSISFGGAFAGVAEPMIQIQNNGGATAAITQGITGGVGGTIVNAGAALELETSLNAEPVELFGNGLQFNGHFQGALVNLSNNNTYNGTLILGSNSTIGADSGSSLSIIGPGTITDEGNSFTLTKEGSGTVALTTANTYGEGTPIGTTVQQGALNIQNAGALGNSATVTTTTSVVDGAQLQVQEPATSTVPFVVSNENLILSGTGISNTGALRDVSTPLANPALNNISWNGAITLAVTPGFAPLTSPSGVTSISVDNSGASLDLLGVIGETVASGLSKVGRGSLILAGNNVYSGTTYINQGNIDIQSAFALGTPNVNDVQRLTVYDPGSADSFSLSFNGQTTGQLKAHTPATGGATPTSSVANALNALSTIGGLPTPGSVSVSEVTVNTGVSEVQSITLTGAIPGVTTLNLTFNGFSTGAITYQGPSGGAADANAIATLLNGLTSIGGNVTVTADPTDTIFTVSFGLNMADQGEPLISAVVSGGSVAVNELTAGAGGVADIYTIMFTGSLASQDQPLLIVTGSGVMKASIGRVADGNIGTLVNPGTALQVDADPTHSGNSFTVVGENLALNGTGLASSANAGAVENVSGNNTWSGNVILQSNTTVSADPTTQFAISGVVEDPAPNPLAPANLTKTGLGTVGLTAANTYTGSTTVGAGILNIQNANALGLNTSAIQVVNVSGTTGSFTLNLTGFPGTTTVSLAPNVPANGGVGPAASMQNALNSMLSSLPAPYGPGATAAVSVNGSNSYLIVFGGTLAGLSVPLLQANPSGFVSVTPVNVLAGGASTTTVNNGATLQLQNVAGGPVIDKPLFLNGTGFNNIGAIDSLSGTNTWGTGITLASNAYLGSEAGSTLNITPAISDNGNSRTVTKVGAGIVAYNNATGGEAYTGTTNVMAGTLQLNDASPAILNNLTVGDNTPVSQIQTVTFTGFNNGDTYTLKLGANTTPAITYFGNASYEAAQIQAALTALVGAGNTATVTPTGTAGVFAVAFGGALAGTNPATMIGATGTGTGNVASVTTTPGGAPAPSSAIAQLEASNQITSTLPVTVNADGKLDINNFSQGIGALTINGGLATTGAGNTGGSLTASSVNIADGTLTTPGSNSIVTDTGDLTMTGGSIVLAGTGSQFSLSGNVVASNDNAQLPATISGAGTLALGSTTHTFNVTDLASKTTNVDMSISANMASTSTGGINKTGAGRLRLLASNPGYAGTTILTAGDLQVDGTIANVILNGGILSGIGSVGTVSGSPAPATPAPGGSLDAGDNTLADPTGTLNTLGVDLGPNSTIIVDLNPNASDFDVLNVTGNILLGNALLTGSILSSTPIPIGTSYTIITATGTVSGPGTLYAKIGNNPAAPIPQFGPVFIGGEKFTVTYNVNSIVLTRALEVASSVTITSSSGTSHTSVYGQDVSFTVTVVPEPGATIPAGDSVTFTLDQGTPNSITVTLPVNSNGQAVWDPQMETPGTQVVPPFTWSLGNHTMDATFTDPTGTFIPVTPAPEFTQTVNQGSTKSTLSTSTSITSTTPVYGQPVTMTASVTPVVPPVTAGASSPTGFVTFTIDPGTPGQQVFAGSINSAGQASIPLPLLAFGTHVIQVTYNGDNNYLTSTSSPNFNLPVKQDSTTVAVSASPASSTLGVPVTLLAAVSPNFPGSAGVPTGPVSFYDGTIAAANLLGIGTIPYNGGSATLITSNLSVATHTIVASYSGLPTVTLLNFNQGDQFTLTFNGHQTSAITYVTDMKAEATAIQNALNQTSILGAGNSATVAQTTDPTIFTITFGGGLTNQKPPLLGAPVSPASGAVQFDDSYGPSSNTLSFTVAKAPTQAAFVNSPPAGSVYGSFVTFTVSVAPNPGISQSTFGTPSGTVSFYDGSQTPANLLFVGALSNSGTSPNQITTASISTNILTQGTHTILAVYSGDPNYAVSAPAQTLITVSSAPTNTALVAFPGSNDIYGSAVTLTATVTSSAGTPTVGTVTFVDSSSNTTLGSANVTAANGGQVTLVTSALSATSHTITATYTDGVTPTNFASSSGQVANYNVAPVATNTTLNASPVSGGVYGQNITFTASITSVAGTPNVGSVTFTDATAGVTLGTQTVTAGKATFVTNSLTAGSHTITANYSDTLPDTNFGTSTGQISNYTIGRASTSTAVSATPASGDVYGNLVTFTATVTSPTAGGPAFGNVTFTDSVTNAVLGVASVNSNGQATLTSSALSVATHNISAAYVDAAPDTNYANSTGFLNGYSVTAVGTVSALGATPTSGDIFGQLVTLTAGVASTAGTPTTGTFTFSDTVGGVTTQLGSAIVNANGQATLTTSALPAGNVTITAVYTDTAPNFNFQSSTATLANYVVSSANTNTAVSATPASGSAVFGQAVTFTATVTSGAGTVGVGKVTFVDSTSGTNLGTSNVNTSGVATLSTTALTSGTHTIVATYNDTAPNTNFNTSSGQINSYAVAGVATSTTLNIAPSLGDIYGQTVTFTASVTSTAGVPTIGSVTFVDTTTGTTLGSQAVNGSGKATLTSAALTAATHTITAFYSDNVNSNFAASSGSVSNYSVAAAPTATAVAASPASGDALGQLVTFTATVTWNSGASPATAGTVSFVDTTTGTALGTGSVNTNGVATITSGALTATTHTITATYHDAAPDTNYGTSIGQLSGYVVNGASTVTSLSVTPSSGDVYGQTITMTATVNSTSAGTPTVGKVTFVDATTNTTLGTATINTNGQASITTTALSAGTHQLNATYTDNVNTNFGTSTGTVSSYTVASLNTTTALSASPPSGASLGQTVTFTGAVNSTAGAPTVGTVTFVDSTTNTTLGTGTVNSSGRATITTTALTAASHTIVANYNDTVNTNFNSSSGQLSNYVVTSATTTTSVTATPSSGAVFGQSMTFTALVTSTAGSPSIGNVSFTIDGNAGPVVAVNASGQATFVTSTLSGGTHQIVAAYTDTVNSNYTSSTGQINYTVAGVGTTTSFLGVTPASGDVFGNTVTMTAAVTSTFGTPTVGTITFVDSSTNTTLGSQSVDNSGHATFSTAALSVGTHTLTAKYSDSTDNNFAPSSGSINGYTVGAASTGTAVSASPSSGDVYGEPVTLLATIMSSAGTPTAGTVNFTDTTTGTPLGSGQVNGSGQASITTNVLTATTHTITATFSNPNFTGSSSQINNYAVAMASTSVNLTSSAVNNTSGAGQSVTFSAAVTAGAPSTMTVNAGTVTFVDGSTTLGTTNVTNGVATFATIGLSQGAHNITANYNGTSNYLPATGSNSGHVTQTVLKVSTMSVTANPSTPTTFGQNVNLSVSVTGTGGTPSGTITVTEGGTQIGQGTLLAGSVPGGINITPKNVGSNSIVVTYSGDFAFAPATQTINLTVNATPTLGTLSNTSGTFNTFYSGTITITGGTPNFTNPPAVTGLPAGLQATVSGRTITISGTPSVTGSFNNIQVSVTDSTGVTATGTYALTINPAATTTALTSTPGVWALNQTVTFTATVASSAGAPTSGTVTFTIDGGVTLTGTVGAGGKATATYTFTSAGNHTVNASFSATTNYNGSTSGTMTQNVRKSSSVSMTATPTTQSAGSPVVFTATIAGGPPSPTGTVTFYDGSTVLGTGNVNSNGVATFSTSSLAIGTHNITASYSGDSNYLGATTANATTVTIKKAGGRLV